MTYDSVRVHDDEDEGLFFTFNNGVRVAQSSRRDIAADVFIDVLRCNLVLVGPSGVGLHLLRILNTTVAERE